MPTDLEIIAQLEKTIGRKLEPLEQIGFRSITSGYSGYTIDDNKNIIGLSLYETQITDISALKELKNLTLLDLSSNQITDISALKELKNLTLLDLSSNQITDISALKDLTNLTLLSLSSNQITDISALKDLTNLTQLYLSSNQITDISALKDLTNLTLLYLSSNQITDISALKDLTNLTQLYLSSNQITDISALKDLTNLTQLYLSSNQITDISALKDLTNLTQLYLSSNQITDISALKDLTNLTQLYLSSNQITDISALKDLTNLTQLYLSSNQITDISALKDLTNLTQLYLWKNQITDISALKDLTNLTLLDLSFSQITDISALKELKNLTLLDLSSNQITDISVLKELKNLTQLSLWKNQITEISALKDLTNLTQLSLWKNQITDISVLKDLTNLTQLDLSFSEITDISVLKDLTNLTQLDLSFNEITDISVLNDLTNLTLLDLRSNNITHLHSEIVDRGMDICWEGDSGIILQNNPLESPPIEIVKKGREAVTDYFKSLEGEKKALNEVKVLLVGDGGAGKTSLVKQLLGENFDVHESQTHGINIRDWNVEDIIVHFWDFGGQEIMHATHQFFLSKRSLYILVLDGRKDEKTEYWLKHIESFGGDSPVFVVINKIDENPGFDVNRRFLQEKYKGIQNFYRVSCAKREGINVFAEGLSKALADVELIQTTWATSWFNVKTQLENITEYFISYEQYEEMCAKENITEKSAQDTLVDFLNDLGVILHFKDFELLDTHVLEPKWVTEAVYKIINSDQLAKSNGVLKLSLLNDILPQKKEKSKQRFFDKFLKHEKETEYYYPTDKYRYIIDLMKKFELCYEIDKETVLLPDLLEVQEPEFGFDYAGALKFVIDYDFLPKSVMPRFIVKMNTDILDELRWRTGVVLEDKAFHSTAVIKADERDEKLYIYVNGEQKRDYFAVIRKTFGDINDSFEKLEAKEFVPLPDNDEITIEYEELIGYEQMNKDDYTAGKLRKTYSVKELLNGIVSEEERKKEYEKVSKQGGDVYLKQEFTQEQKVEQLNVQEQIATQEVNIKIDLKIELPAIQSDFRKFKREVSKLDEELKGELEDLEEDLLEITPTSDQSKINKAVNKLSAFMQELNDEKTKFNKIVKGTKKGIELAQKLGKTYNKFAQWLALPQVPDLFLGA